MVNDVADSLGKIYAADDNLQHPTVSVMPLLGSLGVDSQWSKHWLGINQV